MDSTAATANNAPAPASPEEKRLTTALGRRSPKDVLDWAGLHWQVVVGALSFIPLALGDFWQGHGWAVAPFYAAPVLLSLWSEKPKYSIFFAYTATVLIIAGFMRSGFGGDREFETVQRLSSLALIWLSASLSLQRWQRGRFLERGYQKMEMIVEDHTAELTKANANLQTEIVERQAMESTLRQLSSHLMQAQDQERRRIARELHDNSGQSLAAVAMNLTRIEHYVEDGPLKLKNLVADTAALTEETSREIRTLSYLLHPPLLEEAGLIPAIEWFAKGFTQRSRIETSVDCSAGFERMDDEIEMTLFRIVQECLTNISRHSGSQTAQITMKRKPNDVILTVADEGRGIPHEKLERVQGKVAGLGVGIAGIWERVKHIGGELEITSNSRGTAIMVVLPIVEVHI
ncbi:MAG: sensor histidine kinase [Verrucomicrobiia bacterium]|jgi:signal transduction histidine kinase